MDIEKLRKLALIDYHLFKSLNRVHRVQFVLVQFITLVSLGVFFFLSVSTYLTPVGRSQIVFGLFLLGVLFVVITGFAFLFLKWVEDHPIQSNLLFMGCLLGGGIFMRLLWGSDEVLIAEPVPNSLYVVFVCAMAAFYAANYMLMSLLYHAITAKAEVDTEIALARDIQVQLLPAIQLETAACNIYGFNRPALEVGGDYFDTIQLSQDKLVLVIGDVSGHNLAAGLLMAVTKAAFRTELNYLTEPNAMLASLNRTILENSDKRMFVSLMFAVIDFKVGEITVANAGHNPMLFYRKGSAVRRVGPKGMALGMSNKAFFGVETFPVQSGDLLLMYTDGLQEAQNADGEEFGLERMEALMAKAGSSPTAVCSYLIDAAEQFAGKRLREDDVTLLSMQVG